MRSLSLAVVFGAGLMVGCAHNETLETSARVPAAQGKVKVKTSDNGNSVVKLEVKHLAPPEKVSPGATTYVVWVQGKDGIVQNVGAMDVGKDREAEFEARTPYKDFNLFVTAESAPTASAPSSERLLFTQIDR